MKLDFINLILLIIFNLLTLDWISFSRSIKEHWENISQEN